MDLAVLRKAEVLVRVAVLALKLNSASASESYLEAALDSPNGGLFNALAIWCWKFIFSSVPTQKPIKIGCDFLLFRMPSLIVNGS